MLSNAPPRRRLMPIKACAPQLVGTSGPLRQDLERGSGCGGIAVVMDSMKAGLRKLLQGFTRGAFLAPQRFRLPVIDVALDGIAYQPAQQIRVDGIGLNRLCTVTGEERFAPSVRYLARGPGTGYRKGAAPRCALWTA